MLLIISLLLATAIIYIVKWLKEQNTYWQKRNVKHIKPKLFFGNSFEALTGSKHVAEIIQQVYLKFPEEEVVGFYDYVRPHLIIRKPDLIEKVLVTDFKHFTDRLPIQDQANVSYSANLFNMCGMQWQAFRYKLSPLFKSGKLKHTFDSVSECGKNLTKVLEKNVGKQVDMKEIMELFSMDVIGSSAFGMDPGELQNPTAIFRSMGKKSFSPNIETYIRMSLTSVAPKVANKLGISYIRQNILQYFCDIIANTLQFRKKHGVERKDFLQSMIQLQKCGKIELNNSTDTNTESAQETHEIKITDELLMGTAFGFMYAGFYTISSTITYALYELAQKPDVVHKVRREIKEQMAVHGSLTYDALRCMTYLEKVLKETMRLHPASLSIIRVCTKEYEFPCGLKVTPGDSVIIPVLAIHRDHLLHCDPYSFNPDRFDTIPAPATFLPFGEGPRMCIAMKFAMLEMKLAISNILSKYEITLRTKLPLKISPWGFLNTPKGQVLFNVAKM